MKPGKEVIPPDIEQILLLLKRKQMLTDESLENEALFHAAYQIVIRFNVLATQ